MNDRTGYLCPACGKPATSVDRTTTLPYCIIRIRRCMECGHHHETVELEMEVTKALTGRTDACRGCLKKEGVAHGSGKAKQQAEIH